MSEKTVGPSLTRLLAPWAVCAGTAVPIAAIPAWIGAPELPLRPWFAVALVGFVYWGLGLTFAVIQRLLARGEATGRARGADVLLRLAAGTAVFVLLLVATLYCLSWRATLAGVKIDYSELGDIRELLRVTVWVPLAAMVLAASAWLARRTGLALAVGGWSLCFWLAALAAYYVPVAGVGRDDVVTEERDATKPMCSSERISLTPHKDSISPTGIYIPKDLEDAFAELDGLLPACFIKEFLVEGSIPYHLTIGLWLRNNWGLWHGSRLAKHFNAMGIRHPDDMSGIILTSYYRHLRRQPLRVEEQVSLYRMYWDLMTRGRSPEK